MKKFFSVIFIFLLVLTCILFHAACSNKKDKSTNEQNEVPVAPPQEDVETCTHTPGKWIVDLMPTETENGSKHQICAECNETIKTEIIAALGIKEIAFELNEDKTSYSVVGIGNYEKAELVIPATRDSLPVTGIKAGAFENCTQITSVILPDSITAIGDRAFFGCTALESINVPISVKNIGADAFSGCKNIADITLPIEMISHFPRENIKNVILTAGTAIADRQFWGYFLLESIVLPDDLTSIGEKVFFNCAKLKSIKIPKGVEVIKSETFSGCTLLEAVELPDGITTIGDYAFFGCKALKTINVPISVTNVGVEAFSGCQSIADLTLPMEMLSYFSKENFKNVVLTTGTAIADGQFSGCSLLETLTLPDTVTSIGEKAFRGCEKLKSIKIPNGIEAIKSETFLGCSALEAITLPDTVTSIGEKAFSGCKKLKEIIIPRGVTSIGAYAFSGCANIKTICLPDGVKTIENYTFQYCGALEYVDLGSSVTAIGNFAFTNCSSLKELIIPSGVTSVGNNVFYGCDSISDVTIPMYMLDHLPKENFKNVVLTTGTAIADGQFSIATFIETVTIPVTVTSIGKEAFKNCLILTSINFGGTKAQWNEIEKGEHWDHSTGAYTVKCIDGEIM